MKDWLRGKPGGLAAFLIIAGLVAGGLGWATAAALRLEGEQRAQRAEAEQANRLRLALWRLDSRISSVLAREDSRPVDQYSAVYAPPLALNNSGACWQAGTVMEPSPLLNAELPEWMLLHFQTGANSGWKSPQVLSPDLDRLLRNARVHVPLSNVTARRKDLLAELARDLPAAALLDHVRRHTAPATLHDQTVLLAQRAQEQPAPQAANSYAEVQSTDYLSRAGQQSKLAMNENPKNSQVYARDAALGNFADNGEGWFANTAAKKSGRAEVRVDRSPMVPLWLPPEGDRDPLVVVRLVRIEDKEFSQGILLDGPRLQGLLADEVADLFPGARLVPEREAVPPEPGRTMSALPFRLDPGPAEGAPPGPGWTPLRVGLTLAWAAALVALLAVGLGGWSLFNLSERRIRFVSAVTHELRTPLTTLRLYLDMLANGLVRDEGQRREYIATLHAEAERLHRLVGNVLDFSRLEKQRPRLARGRVAVDALLAQVRATWQGRCHDADKELIVAGTLAPGAALWTDGGLLQQVLGNLIDNACKYSRGAEDRRLWVRARADRGRLVFEVEDRGPGVPARERRSIFRAFRRGRRADETTGGVGLGLALARRWTRLLGGRLTLAAGAAGGGACFRAEFAWDGGPPPEA
jgi:signal transduction histidine kinase